MLKYILSFSLGLFFLSSFGAPKVPSSYEFAGIQLSITEAARKQIQEDVDALHRNQTYFNRKVEKVDLYFPIIERVFREERIPDDFKYLTIQESALISDAVSSSNAVGFWQFKKASAIEVGLRVDNYIDERMHITASSRGAAKYLKKNNFFFNNWVYALLAYNTGPGGAEIHVDKKYFGKSKMEINKNTHWYVKKFLAHKIAFENEINKNYTPTLSLYEYDKTQNKSLKELSEFFEIDSQVMADYNKWLRKGRIPADKEYLAIIPIGTNDLVAQNLAGTGEKPIAAERQKTKIVFQPIYKPVSEFDFTENREYPKTNSNTTSTRIKINGIPGFIASSIDNMNSVLIQYGISEKKFLKYNDLTSASKISGGQVYYLKSKKSKAKIHYHVVIAGESAWSISQKYGITIKSLLTKNRMREEKDLSPGMVVWLRFIRPNDVPVEFKKSDVQNVIVQSVPNQIEYPIQNPAPETESKVEDIKESATDVQMEEDFLFDEVNEETAFINENSYVDLKNESADSQLNLSTPEAISSSAENPNNVKKEELYHIVKSSETLFSISRTYGVTIGEIRQWNDIDDLDILAVGQRILIKKPTGYSPESDVVVLPIQPQTYRVRADDTLYGIARKNNITIKELMELNNKTDFVIKEGEILKIRPAR